MHLRATFAALCGLVLVAGSTVAQDKPTLVVRVPAVDSLTAKGKYLAKLLDQADLFDQVEGFLKAFTGPRGIDGLDPVKPLGLYGKLGPNGLDSEVVFLAPISDTGKFLAFLKKSGFPAEERKGGLYKLDVPNVPLPGYLRFANGYVYFTVGQEENLDEKRLVKPESILPADQIGLLTLLLDLEQIPESMRKLALQFLEDQRKLAQEKIPANLNPVEKSFQVLLQEVSFDTLRSIIKEGGPVALRVDINEAREELNLSLAFASQPETKLARDLAGLGDLKSVAGGTLPTESIVSGTLHVALPTRLAEGLAAFEKNIRQEIARQPDPRGREAVTGLLDAMLPTVKAGVIDIGVALVATGGGKHAIVTAGKVVQGSTIETALKKIFDLIPAPEKEKIQLKVDADKVGTTNIHAATFENPDPNGQRLFGKGTAHFALREDALLSAFGTDSLPVLKKAVASEPRSVGLMSLNLRAAKFLSLLPPDEARKIEPAFKKVFGANPQARDTIRVALHGGKELKLELTVPATIVQLGTEIAKSLRGE